jgi:eukaryotic-like serine/threonine-protein kinase
MAHDVISHDTLAACIVEDMPTQRFRKSTPPEASMSSQGPLDPLEATALAFKKMRQGQGTLETTLDSWCLSFPGQQEHARLFRDLHRSDPHAADRLAHALLAMPVIGADFLGFHLMAELGRGGLARVYLAKQEDLANRPVVVKVAPDLWGEANTLAQLQHPNIVPVYSVHQREPFQVVCMPYQGWTTFQDILREVQKQTSLPTAGSFLSTVFKKAPAGSTQGSPGTAFAGTLAGLCYVEAVVWLGAQLADGLAHAHEHGIVHHDLKPANILLTDEGQPMLLDFNAAEDTKGESGAMMAWVAGTLPYMAPEQLAVLQGTTTPVDARCDLFAFGVILFELLTGRYPFKCRRPEMGAVFAQAVEDRRGAPPHLRNWNPAVSPALEAIVRRCLEPNPYRRYQTARELQEDLQRQHAHRPLLHIAEPSAKERLEKWLRRHPRMRSACVVGAFACILLTAVGTVSMIRGNQLAEWQTQERKRIERQQAQDHASAAWAKFHDEIKTAQFILYTRTNEPEQLAGGVAIGLRLVNDYGVIDNPSWRELPLVQALPSTDRIHLGESMAELLLLVARALSLQSGDAANGSPSRARLEKALVMNERAADCSAHVSASPALWRQRGVLYAALGQEAKARECLARAEALPLRTAADHYWLASDFIAAGRLPEALHLLQKAAYEEPQNFWVSFVLANCYDRLAQDARAEARYGICIALQPSYPWSHFNRGLALLRQQDYRAACADFDTVLKLRPDSIEAYLNRALARQGVQQFQQAEQDLTEALERGGPTRLYFLRARIREKRGAKDGAKDDYEEGMKRPPTDEKSWLARGFYLIGRDPQAALADFDEALRINPASADALQNKAHVLAEKLGRNQESLQVLNKSLELYPDSVKARGGRGVLHARLGQREPALRDAEETLRRDASPPRLYQVACIYALTSKEQPEDRFRAFQLLSSALTKGYGFNLLETDTDLNPIRSAPEFRRLVEAARALRTTSPKVKKS